MHTAQRELQWRRELRAQPEVRAVLLRQDGRGELRPYYFPREEYEADLRELREKEMKFLRYVQEDRVPPASLRI